MRLYSGAPYWLVKDGLVEIDGASPPSASDAPFDVAIIGAGITGALVADALTAEGLSVAILDRRAPATGSTAASTALVTYELDAELQELVERLGEPDAVRAYQISAGAIADLEKIAVSLEEPCGFARRPSLYLATKRRHAARLEREAALRQRHGLDAAYWTPQRVEETHGFPSHGALYTKTAAVLDPVRLTRALLRRASAGGARLFARTRAQAVVSEGRHVRIGTSRGEVRARRVVYAMGYETPEPLRPDSVALHSTYALVTEPVEDLGRWRDQCLVWETQRPYFYMRATEDGRILCGGADVPFKDATIRDQLIPNRTKRLEKRLKELLPTVETETAFAWGGTFAVTPDSLPLIGPSASCPNALFALGYGANGITFGAVAARMLRDLCLGRDSDAAYLFRLNR